MKRYEVVRRIRRAADAAGVEWGFKRQGRSHFIYSLGGKEIIVSRSTEIPEPRWTFRDCEEKLGKGWWRP